MKMNKDKIFKILEENRKFLKRQGVVRLELFGSYARGEESGSSDIDFVVEFDNKSFDCYMDLKMFLEDTFKCRVDLVLASTIKPRLREIIRKEAIHAPGI